MNYIQDKRRVYNEKNKEHIRVVNRRWKQRNWSRRMVCHSRGSDVIYGRLPADMSNYIDPNYLQRLRTAQGNRCPFCTVDMQTENRKHSDGLTIQRLNNTIGHTKANCLLSCFQCNCKRVETGCNDDYLQFKRGRLYFERLLEEGYPYATSLRTPRNCC
jgi:hypothetical protein